ncbi:MAG: hypothetical protein OXE77_01590 [Flavobacteriaceae bacterium]|nr:hypothetical protein [Flavobacteriaceae bacterium]MCY4266493.1 hypothetical protein [Flavobacteriaceae bacterium]
MRPFLGISGPINIDDSTRQSLSIYGTVIYELAHAAPWNQGRWGFHATDDYVLESCSRGVQGALTALISPGYVPDHFKPNYTAVVKEMIDSDTSIGIRSHVRGYSELKDKKELVAGYTIEQIESSLKGK